MIRYTAPRIDLIPEQQERYQVIENLMLLQNSMRKGKEILRQFRHQRSSWLTLPYKNLFYLSLDHLLSTTTRIPNPRPNQVCCTLFIQIPPLWLYRCILKKVLCLGREPPRRTLSSETIPNYFTLSSPAGSKHFIAVITIVPVMVPPTLIVFYGLLQWRLHLWSWYTD